MSYHQPQAAFYDSRAYDLPPTRSDDGAGGGQRQQPNYEPRGLMPLTIKQILQALPGDSGELVVRGRPLQQVRVVGQYAEESRRGSNAHFFIHDSTGQLSCTSSLEGNDAMVRVVERLQHLRSYVSVVGKVRQGNSMFVYHARILTDFNELIHHNIECIYEDLKAKAALASHGQAAAQPMQQPQQLPGHRVYPDKPLQVQAPAGQRAYQPQPPSYSPFAAINPPPAVRPANGSAQGAFRGPPGGASYNTGSLAHFAPTTSATVWPPPQHAANQLRSQIVGVMRNNAREDGVSVKMLDMVVKDASIVDISKEISRMLEDGTIYAAGDLEHFKLTN